MADMEERARRAIVAICAIEPPDAQKSADIIAALLREAVEEEHALMRFTPCPVSPDHRGWTCAECAALRARGGKGSNGAVAGS